MDLALDVQGVRYSEVKSIRNPVQPSEVMFNILAPGVIEQHVSGGVSKVFANGHALHVALTKALSNTVTGPNPLEAPGRQQIALTMRQWDIEFGYSIKFGNR